MCIQVSTQTAAGRSTVPGLNAAHLGKGLGVISLPYLSYSIIWILPRVLYMLWLVWRRIANQFMHFCICVHLASSVHVNLNYYHYLCMFLLQLSGPDVYHGVPHDYTNLVCVRSSGVGPIYVLLYVLEDNAIVGVFQRSMHIGGPTSPQIGMWFIVLEATFRVYEGIFRVLEGFFNELECLLRELESFFRRSQSFLWRMLIYRLVHAFLIIKKMFLEFHLVLLDLHSGLAELCL